jgi:hypothetical protein
MKSRSCIACALKLSSTFVNGHSTRYSRDTASNGKSLQRRLRAITHGPVALADALVREIEGSRLSSRTVS